MTIDETLCYQKGKKMHFQAQTVSSFFANTPLLSPPHRLSAAHHRIRTSSLSAAHHRIRTSSPARARCSLSKPLPAEVTRTIMELSSVGTLSTLTHDHWPLGVGVRFAVDSQGTPVFCFNQSTSLDSRSSLHVQFDQCGLKSSQCTILGNLAKPEDTIDLQRLHAVWRKKFEEDVDEDLIYYIAVERVLQKEDYLPDGAWIPSSEYKNAAPDPLRKFAEKIVNEINAEKKDDVLRFCNIFVDLDFQVSEAKMIWVDRLGFDMRMSSPNKGDYEVRIPFPREVTDEKGVKSSFNCMSQLAWESEKHYDVPRYEKVKQLKHVAQPSLI